MDLKVGVVKKAKNSVVCKMVFKMDKPKNNQVKRKNKAKEGI